MAIFTVVPEEKVEVIHSSMMRHINRRPSAYWDDVLSLGAGKVDLDPGDDIERIKELIRRAAANRGMKLHIRTIDDSTFFWASTGGPFQGRFCRRCGVKLSMRGRVWCGRKCEWRYEFEKPENVLAREEANERARFARGVKNCLKCSSSFNPRQRNGVFCSKRCRYGWRKIKERFTPHGMAYTEMPREVIELAAAMHHLNREVRNGTRR